MNRSQEIKIFSIGDFVRTPGIRASLEVIEGPNRKGQYLLRMGSVKTWVHGDLISLSPPALKGQKQKKSASSSKLTGQPKLTVQSKLTLRSKLDSEEGISKPALKIDLHGLRRSEAQESLEKALDRALMEGRSQLQIIHGHGTGALKVAVHQYLSKSRHVKAFRLDSNNAAVTIAEL